MIRLKSAKEIEILREGGKILARILRELSEQVKPGVTSREIDEMARELIKKYDVKSSFLGYKSGSHAPYPGVTCVSVNEGVVHGIPGKRIFQEGDIVGLDCGIIHRGMYLDAARSAAVGSVSLEIQELMAVTRQALSAGIREAQVGNRIGDIGAAIQSVIKPHGYGIVTDLVGHGVGYDVHEDPKVPNVGEAGAGPRLAAGLVIAIEPMVTLGKAEITTGADGWTIETRDGSAAAHEEHTIAVTNEGPIILTNE